MEANHGAVLLALEAGNTQMKGAWLVSWLTPQTTRAPSR